MIDPKTFHAKCAALRQAEREHTEEEVRFNQARNALSVAAAKMAGARAALMAYVKECAEVATL